MKPVKPRVRRRVGRILGDRRFIGGLLLVLQALGFLFLLTQLTGRWRILVNIFNMISVVMVVWLVRKEDNPAYKTAWIVIILTFPLFGGIFYLFWGNTPFNQSKLRHQFAPRRPRFNDSERQPASGQLCAELARHAAKCRYIENITGMPAWTNTSAEYFSVGEDFYQSMLEELPKAKKFIFLEYFIIEPGLMWDSILEILTKKAAEGVDVRLIYDDAGTMGKLPSKYDRYLRSLGLRVVRFNQFIPTLNTYLNNRDHRKICVIDGEVSFMGGINLADEYINHVVRFGHWRDTGICMKGDATFNATMMFLQMWEYSTGEKIPADTSMYCPSILQPGSGYIQPFGDSPLDRDNVGELVYMQMITNARRYVYITTPYLVLDNEMLTALSVAAKSGVDVRLIMPGIPDKKLVYMVTRSFYPQLFRAGVRLYEYRPGFLHAKMIVADDDIAVVGTMNMDFRSFYMHFECGTVFYANDVVQQVREDIEEIMAVSREIDEDWLRHVSWPTSIAASLLRLFAPML